MIVFYSQCVPLYSQSHANHNQGRDETHCGKDTHYDIHREWSKTELPTLWQAEATSIYVKVEAIGTLKFIDSCAA